MVGAFEAPGFEAPGNTEAARWISVPPIRQGFELPGEDHCFRIEVDLLPGESEGFRGAQPFDEGGDPS